MATIKLTQGYSAIIDDSDLPLISRYSWHAVKSRGRVYAAYSVRLPHSRAILMHKLLLTAERVDHIDGNGLNNRRDNLRPATHSENMQNRKKTKFNTSGFKGVWSDGKGWQARIGVNGKRLYLGWLQTAEEAARAYDKAAEQHHGAFAVLNFTKEQENE